VAGPAVTVTCLLALGFPLKLPLALAVIVWDPAVVSL
jgi:hypothetical protein